MRRIVHDADETIETKPGYRCITRTDIHEKAGHAIGLASRFVSPARTLWARPGGGESKQGSQRNPKPPTCTEYS